ncbi:MAG: hypothetical protein IK015_11945 [Treponema sp.]|nr:hypothetical protein [Treponema sp.]
MILFLLMLFPLSFAVWICSKKEPKAPYFFNAFLGLFLAAVFCAYKYFFSPYYFLTPDSFFRNFIHIFLEEILLPLAVLTAAFLFIYKKDKIASRIQSIFPFYMGFYAVYTPFRVLSGEPPYPAFALFVKPAMFLFMVLVLNSRQKVLFVPAKRALLSAKEAAIYWASFVVDLLMPAAVEALWILGMKPPLTILFLLIYAAGAYFCLLRAASDRTR